MWIKQFVYNNTDLRKITKCDCVDRFGPAYLTLILFALNLVSCVFANIYIAIQRNASYVDKSYDVASLSRRFSFDVSRFSSKRGKRFAVLVSPLSIHTNAFPISTLREHVTRVGFIATSRTRTIADALCTLSLETLFSTTASIRER